MKKQYYTIREAAAYLGISTVTLRNWDKKGKLSAARNPVNNYRLYTMDDLEGFLKKIEGKRPRKLNIEFIKD